MTKQRETDYLKVAILCLGGGIVYMLPYLRFSYYDAMIEGLRLTNTQLGTVMSFYGLFAVPSYFLGGIVADKIKAKHLLTFSFLATGLGGGYLATLPGYYAVLAIHGLWGISTGLTFWAAFNKSIRLSASSNNQSKIFGLVTGMKKIVAVIAASIGLWFFSRGSNDVVGFQHAVIAISSLYFATGLATIFCWKDRVVENEEKAGAFTVKDTIVVLKMPEIWLLCATLFGLYGCYRLSDFFTPFLSQGVGMGATLTGILGAAKNYCVAPLSGLLSGYMGDKIGRTKWSRIAVSICILSMLGFLVIPVTSQMLTLVNIVLFMLFIWCAWGIVFSLLDDAGIPDKYSGTAVGIVSCVGLLPEVITPYIGGYFMDTYPGIKGFHCIFIASAVFGVFSVIFYTLYKRRTEANKAMQEPSGMPAEQAA